MNDKKNSEFIMETLVKELAPHVADGVAEGCRWAWTYVTQSDTFRGRMSAFGGRVLKEAAPSVGKHLGCAIGLVLVAGACLVCKKYLGGVVSRDVLPAA